MANRATFTLRNEAFAFMEKAILKASWEEDPAYQEELADWDPALSDGLDPDRLGY